MILSAQQLFCDDQAITASADSENVIDLGVPGTPYGGAAALTRDVGKGNMVPILVQVTADFATLTSLTINVSKGSATTLGTKIASQTIAASALVAGAQFAIQVLPSQCDERYLGLEFVVTGSNATAGTITAGISMGNQTNV